jgi:hypothetical protein
MAKINKEKSDKAALIAKMWQTVRYQNKITNCGNCVNSNDNAWEDDSGVCNLVDISFPINRRGICRQHSVFTYNKDA